MLQSTRECSLGVAFAFFILACFTTVEIANIFVLAFTYSPSLASCSAPLKLYLLIQTILGAGVLLSFLFGWAIRHSRLRLAAIISLSLLLFGLVIMMGLGLVWLSRREGYCDTRIQGMSWLTEVSFFAFGLIFVIVLLRMYYSDTGREESMLEEVVDI